MPLQSEIESGVQRASRTVPSIYDQFDQKLGQASGTAERKFSVSGRNQAGSNPYVKQLGANPVSSLKEPQPWQN